jgi:hypothetical protein
MKTKVFKAKCGYTELVFDVNGTQYVLSRDYKSGQPLMYWFNIGIGKEILNFDIRNLGIDEEEFTMFLLESNTVQVLRKVRDVLLGIVNFVGKVQEVAWRPTAKAA